MAVFENFTIPHFKEAKELAIQAARVMPDLRLIGWDIAIGMGLF
jgi:Sugar-transfer associated ATP-grasp